jgi:hypothetical protein
MIIVQRKTISVHREWNWLLSPPLHTEKTDRGNAVIQTSILGGHFLSNEANMPCKGKQ